MNHGSSGRRILAAALKTALPGWQVIDAGRQPDVVRKPGAIMLWTQTRKRAPGLSLGWFVDEITLQVLTAADKVDVIEDDLDNLLLQVMTALEPLDQFAWDTAERVAVNDKFHGWQMAITCIFSVTPIPDP